MTREDFGRTFLQAAARNGVEVADRVVERLFAYYEELFIWNRRINLIASGERTIFVERHLVDSLCVLKLDIPQNSALLDLGSGNGLPGIPLAIALPEVRIDLLESRAKRCTFLRHVISRLGLRNARVLCGRLEERQAPPGKYHYVLARGVRVSKGMAVLIQHLLDEEGALILFQGKHGVAYSGKMVEHDLVDGVGGRKLVVVRNVRGPGKSL